jgi:hypothetical protein
MALIEGSLLHDLYVQEKYSTFTEIQNRLYLSKKIQTFLGYLSISNTSPLTQVLGLPISYKRHLHTLQNWQCEVGYMDLLPWTGQHDLWLWGRGDCAE